MHYKPFKDRSPILSQIIRKEGNWERGFRVKDLKTEFLYEPGLPLVFRLQFYWWNYSRSVSKNQENKGMLEGENGQWSWHNTQITFEPA